MTGAEVYPHRPMAAICSLTPTGRHKAAKQPGGMTFPDSPRVHPSSVARHAVWATANQRTALVTILSGIGCL